MGFKLLGVESLFRRRSLIVTELHPRILKIYVKQKKKKNEDGKNLPSPNSILYARRLLRDSFVSLAGIVVMEHHFIIALNLFQVLVPTSPDSDLQWQLGIVVVASSGIPA